MSTHSACRFAVLSHVLPPSPSGQATVLYRLLRDLNPEAYCLISDTDYGARAADQEVASRLSARYYHVPLGWQIPKPKLSPVRNVFALFNAGLVLARRILAVVRILRAEGCEVIVACTGDPFNLPAGLLASKLTRVRLVTYLFDDYARQWIHPAERLLAERIEPVALRSAVATIVPNEFLRDEYRQRYGVEPVVIHNPHEPSSSEFEAPWPADPTELRIVYTGAVYGAHYDAFRNLLHAIKLMGRPEVKLHVYTAHPRDDLVQEGLVGPVVYHNHLPLSATLDVQRRADILFLPLAFDSPYSEEIVRTSAPGKMGEYLASGRPILVHAPPDVYVSWYFKTHNAGKVVDQPDPHVLAEAIQQILNEPDLRKAWRENARQRARSDFGLETAQAKFLETLGAT